MFDYLGIDWGSKKCGLAIGNSDNALILYKEIVPISNVFAKLSEYLKQYPTLMCIVISENKSFVGGDTDNSKSQKEFANKLRALYPKLKVVLFSEHGTTKAYGKDNDDQSAAELLRLYFVHELRVNPC